MSDFADELAVRGKLQQLRAGRRISGTRRVATMEYKNMSLGIDGYAGNFTEIHVGRQLQEIGNRAVRNFGD